MRGGLAKAKHMWCVTVLYSIWIFYCIVYRFSTLILVYLLISLIATQTEVANRVFGKILKNECGNHVIIPT